MLTIPPEAVWNSVVSVATKDRWFLRFSIRRSCSVSLCGLPLRVWAVVAPRHFHFTITTLTFDQGSSSKRLTDLLERWHPIYGATLKVTELFIKAIVLPVLVYRDCMAVCSNLYTCQ
jgi:hypothetical protein